MQSAICTRNLCVHYGTTQVLFDINLTVEKGIFFGLLGVNGAGKSTLLGTINTLLTPSSGTIHIQGIDLGKNPHAAKLRLGVVPQEINLNNFELVRNVLFAQAGYFGLRKHRVVDHFEHLLHELDLWDKRDAWVRQLSGGMKRRLMIARALITKPEVLLLDEPTAGVDVNIRRHLWQFIKRINQQGTTIVLTTHYLEEAEALCDQIAVIEQGAIIRQDSKESILRSLDCQTLLFETKHALPATKIVVHCGAQVEYTGAHELRVTVPNHVSMNDIVNEMTALGIVIISIRPEKNRLETLVCLLKRTKINVYCSAISLFAPA